jgi:hypothetical protein
LGYGRPSLKIFLAERKKKELEVLKTASQDNIKSKQKKVHPQNLWVTTGSGRSPSV